MAHTPLYTVVVLVLAGAVGLAFHHRASAASRLIPHATSRRKPRKRSRGSSHACTSTTRRL